MTLLPYAAGLGFQTQIGILLVSTNRWSLKIVTPSFPVTNGVIIVTVMMLCRWALYNPFSI